MPGGGALGRPSQESHRGRRGIPSSGRGCRARLVASGRASRHGRSADDRPRKSPTGVTCPPRYRGPVNQPAVVVCAHGTDDPDGRATVLGIAAAVAARLPGVVVRDAYVDVQSPTLGEVVDELVAAGLSVVVVPVLLTLGFHTEVDVARAVGRHPGRVVSTGPLGPHEALVDALLGRLAEASVAPGTPLVVAVAGSSRPAAIAVGHGVGDAVAARWDGPVTVGFLSAASPTVPDAVAAARAQTDGPVAAASYLVGRGFFQRKLERAGADAVSAPLGVHPRLIDVVVERYRAGASELVPDGLTPRPDA
nr:CbiX/SirB N-terminal domain-containing protein [Propioniciclava soli]